VGSMFRNTGAYVRAIRDTAFWAAWKYKCSILPASGPGATAGIDQGKWFVELAKKLSAIYLNPLWLPAAAVVEVAPETVETVEAV
jgi:hypothetical protein